MKSNKPSADFVKKEYNGEFNRLIKEGISKYGGEYVTPYLPPVVRGWPKIIKTQGKIARSKPFFGGRIVVHEGPVEYGVILRLAKSFSLTEVKILDIGCSDCGVADFLKINSVKFDYTGVDISRVKTGYKVLGDLSQVKGKFDLVIMTHVAEHMTYNQFLDDFLSKIPLYLNKGGIFVFAVPNPVNLKTQFGDLGHIQIYPWHQTYALLRFFFKEVDVYRGAWFGSLSDVMFFPLRSVFCRLVGVDYAWSLIFVCKA